MVARAYIEISEAVKSKNLTFLVDTEPMFSLIKILVIFFTLDILVSLVKEQQVTEENLGIYLKDSMKFYVKKGLIRDIISTVYFYAHFFLVE